MHTPVPVKLVQYSPRAHSFVPLGHGWPAGRCARHTPGDAWLDCSQKKPSAKLQSTVVLQASPSRPSRLQMPLWLQNRSALHEFAWSHARPVPGGVPQIDELRQTRNAPHSPLPWHVAPAAPSAVQIEDAAQ